MKLGFLSYLSIGIALAVIILSFAYFMKYQPDMEEAKGRDDHAQALEAEGAKLPQAQKRYAQAVQMVNQTVTDWQNVVATRTPPNSLQKGGINMAVNAWQMTVDVRYFRNSIQSAVNRQIKHGGVTVVNGPTIPFPSDNASGIIAEFFNYPAIPFPVVIFDLGQVTVEGTYEQIKENMKGWSTMPNYLAVADGLALTGTAPVLTGTYNLTIVGYVKADAVYPAVREGGAPSTGGAGGGAGAAGGPGGRAGGGGGKGRAAGGG